MIIALHVMTKFHGLLIIGEDEIMINLKISASFFFTLIFSTLLLLNSNLAGNIYINSALYQDWMGFKSTDTEFYNRLSSRLKLELLKRPGDGWTLSFDIRNRTTLGDGGSNQFIIYNSNISFNNTSRRIFFTLGQMNLYDTAGIGELTGILAGFRLKDELSIGAYGGLNPEIYNSRWDLNYRKYGFFTTFKGKKARRISLSYNKLQYDGQTEREYVYANTLFPVSSKIILYGSIEYELKEGLRSEDRISRLFVNTRIDPFKMVSINFNYSSGKGIDYHQFILDLSMNPILRISDIERFYYSETYGVRLTVTPIKNLRIHLSKRFSEQKDEKIKNDSMRFGISSANLFNSGFGIYGNYTLNRGDLSESDSYRFSISRNLNRISGSLSFSSYFNSIRFVNINTPEIIFHPDRRTLTADLFYYLNRSLAFSMEYSFSFSKGFNDHQFFLRMIYRKRQNKVKK